MGESHVSNNRWLFRAFKTLGPVLAMGLSMSASASFFGFGGTSWKEEVLLHDGSKIIVDRAVEYGGRHEIGQSPPFKEQTLTFTLPSIKQRVTWKDEYSDDVGSSNFNPVLVEVFGDTAYVLGSPVNSESYSKWGCPNPPYVVFKYQDKGWKRIALNQLPAEVKLPNLVISSPDDVAKKAKHGLLTAEMIKQENEGFRQPEFRTILRDPVANTGMGCLVKRKGGGWESPGGSKAPFPILPSRRNDDKNKN
jgi:hypothetical protein